MKVTLGTWHKEWKEGASIASSERCRFRFSSLVRAACPRRFKDSCSCWCSVSSAISSSVWGIREEDACTPALRALHALHEKHAVGEAGAPDPLQESLGVGGMLLYCMLCTFGASIHLILVFLGVVV